jgi:hypothetical protein
MFAIIQFLMLNSIVISFAQTETKVQIASDFNVTYQYQNVQTESTDVNGTKFVYRKLGSDRNGIPVIFINHLAWSFRRLGPKSD